MFPPGTYTAVPFSTPLPTLAVVIFLNAFLEVAKTINFFQKQVLVSWEYLFIRIRCSFWNLFQRSIFMWWLSSAVNIYIPRVGKAKVNEASKALALEVWWNGKVWWLILKQVMLIGLHRFWILRNYLINL